MSIDNLSECKNAGSGCFASDPEALDFVRFNGDIGIQRNNQALIDGAVESAQQGVPFEEASYRPISIINITNGGEGFPRLIAELADEGADGDLKMRAARCAYACGSSAVGSCPLIQTSSPVPTSV